MSYFSREMLMSGDGDPYTPGTVVWEQGGLLSPCILNTSSGYWTKYSTTIKNEKLNGAGWYQIILIGGGQRCSTSAGAGGGVSGGGGQAIVANVYIKDTDTVTITSYNPLIYVASAAAAPTTYINYFGNSRHPASNLRFHLSSISSDYDLISCGGGNYYNIDGYYYFVGQQASYYTNTNINGGNYGNYSYYWGNRINNYVSYAGETTSVCSDGMGYGGKNGFSYSNVSTYSNLFDYGKGESIYVTRTLRNRVYYYSYSTGAINTGGYFRLTYIGQTI